MNWCSVGGCEEVKSSGIRTHSFPEVDKIELRERWIKFCGQQPEWKPKKQAKICGAHFVNSDFGVDLKGNIKRKLKSGAFPSLKVCYLSFNPKYF